MIDGKSRTSTEGLASSQDPGTARRRRRSTRPVSSPRTPSQKVGNGHPGTAMSLAPLAYLLFQKVMRRDPSDSTWIGRDRFILSAGHSSLTQYIQFYLGGYGLELEDLEAAAHVGLEDAGPPRVRPHRRRRDHHRPARPGFASSVGFAYASPLRARPVRPRRRPGHEPVRPLRLRDRRRRRHAGGRHQRGLLARRHQQLGNLIVVLRPQPDLDRGRHQHRLLRGRRRPLRGARLARPGRRLEDDGDYNEDVQALHAAILAAQQVTDKPSLHRR